MKKFISLLLVLSLCLCLLSACSAKTKLLGSWQCDLDLTDQVRQLLEAEELGGDLPFSDFSVTLRLTFFPDDRFSLTLDQDNLTKAFSKLSEALEEGLMDTLQQQLAEAGLNVAIDSLLGLSGLATDSLTEKLRQAFGNANLSEKLTESIELEGYYKASGDKLLLTDDSEAKLDNIYFPYTLEGNTLTLSAQVGQSTFLGNHPFFGTSPITFTRTN